MAVDRTNKMSRERILEGAVAILDSGRYADLTVDALARSLHMSKSTLYKYFSSKEDVIIALVRDACERAESEVERTLSGGTAAEQLTELALIVGRHGQRLPRAVSTEPEKLPYSCVNRLQQTNEAFARAAQLLVDRGLSRGEFKFPDARVAAVAFVSGAQAVLMDGARLGISGYGDALQHLPKLFLPGLRGGAK
jgi:AcrR family transcriptional regulator